jgi:hypothetical protein
MLQYVLAANYSQPQGAKSAEDMYSVLYRSSNMSGKIFIHISVNTQI